MPFDFKVLTEFEVGQAMAAIEGVARLDKPIAEVGCRIGSADDIERDPRLGIVPKPQMLPRRPSPREYSIHFARRFNAR